MTVAELPLPTRAAAVWRWDGQRLDERADTLAEETAVCLRYNGKAQAVMMATPADLEDFARGFSLTEGIVDDVAEITALEVAGGGERVTIDLTVPEERGARLFRRRRALQGRSGCGQCGIVEPDEMLRRPPEVAYTLSLAPASLHRACAALAARQSLGAITGTLHAAAWADRDGALRIVREDVGRHNALDKLVGQLLWRGLDRADGFVLLTSRASHEMVQKSVLAGVELLAAVSGATALAARLAAHSRLTLAGFVRAGQHVVYACPERLEIKP